MVEDSSSIRTKQSRIKKLMERLLNLYDDKLVFLQAEYHT